MSTTLDVELNGLLLTAFGLISPATRSEAVATLTAKDYSSQPTVGIIATSAANFTFQLENDTGNVTIPVLAGVHYPMRVKSIDITSVATVLALFDS